MAVDRDEVLARTDLGALADELLGPRRGAGSAARWPSPVPGHPQSGRTPPMSVFTDHHGVQRWTCWATAASGTAVDLVATVHQDSVGDALRWLSERAGLRGPLPAAAQRSRPARPPPAQPLAASPRPAPAPALEDYVAACEAWLATPGAAGPRRWLTKTRGLDAAVLAANRVGFDPGPRLLERPPGLPRGQGGVVFAVHDEAGALAYCQVRYLRPPRGGASTPTPPPRWRPTHRWHGCGVVPATGRWWCVRDCPTP